MNSFLTPWSLERCRWLQRIGDRGPLEVVFGGDHLSLPSLRNVTIGDVIYPVAVCRGGLSVIARIGVEELCSPDAYVKSRLTFVRPAAVMWDQLFAEIKVEHKDFGHRFPTTCCDIAAVGSGSEIRFDRLLPADLLSQVMLGSKPGHEQPLKGIKDGKLTNNYSLQGHVRRLSEGSAQFIEGLF